MIVSFLISWYDHEFVCICVFFLFIFFFFKQKTAYEIVMWLESDVCSSDLLLYPGGMCFSHLDLSDTSSTLKIWLSPIPRIGWDPIYPCEVLLMLSFCYDWYFQVAPSILILADFRPSLSLTVISDRSRFWFIPFKELDLTGPFIPRLVDRKTSCRERV